MPRDYYQILGVSHNAGEDEIKRAYRQLARRYHPDVNKSPEANEHFKEINEAYEVLKDPQKRAYYERFGTAGPAAGAGFGGFDFGGFDFSELMRDFGFETGGGFGDIFDIFFGPSRSGRRSGRQRGEDIQETITLTLEEIVSDVEKELEIYHLQTCGTCGGTGAKAGTKMVTCSNCAGQGKIRKTHSTILGSFTQIVTCSECGGEGKVIKELCADCRGEGRLKKKKTVRVTVPGGIEDGARLRISGAGNAGLRSALPGDLYILVRVAPDKIFKREGANIFSKVKIGFVQAILGTEIEVPVLGGHKKITIQAGTQPETELRIEGGGLPNLRGRLRGDHFIKVVVEIPKFLDEEQRKLVEELARLRKEKANFKKEEKPAKTHDSFFGKVKAVIQDDEGRIVFY